MKWLSKLIGEIVHKQTEYSVVDSEQCKHLYGMQIGDEVNMVNNRLEKGWRLIAVTNGKTYIKGLGTVDTILYHFVK